jgi:hypothetical protein
MTVGLYGIADQTPATRAAVQRRVYSRFLDLRLWAEIVEDGMLRGAG